MSFKKHLLYAVALWFAMNVIMAAVMVVKTGMMPAIRDGRLVKVCVFEDTPTAEPER